MTLSANPEAITVGGSSALSWSSVNTTSCSASWTTATSTSGSQEVTPSSTTEYSISCVGEGQTASATTTITVNPAGGGGGNGGGGNGGGGGGGSSNIGGHRRDISNLLAPQGEILGATSCMYLKDFLRRDWNNDPIEVLKMQSFLNVFENENLSLTSVFDEPTFQAVSRFQNKYFYDILEPWGHDAPTGFVYILTKKKVNEIYCNTVIALNQGEKDEIIAFRALMDSLKAGGADKDILSTFSLDQSSSTIGEDVFSEDVLKDTSEGESLVVELKYNSFAGSVLKNLAITLFSIPQNISDIFSDRTNLIIAIVVLIIILVIGGILLGSKREKQNSVPINPDLKSKSKKESIIILPGAKKNKEEILPGEDIVIDEEDEVEGEIK